MLYKEEAILKEMTGILSSDRRIVKVVVFGSRVRGDFRGDSDLDLLIVVRQKDREIKGKILDLLYSYELNRDISFSLTLLSLEELAFNEQLGSPFLKTIMQEGIILYDAESRGKEIALKVSPGEGATLP